MLFNKKKEESPIKADETAKTAEDEEKKDLPPNEDGKDSGENQQKQGEEEPKVDEAQADEAGEEAQGEEQPQEETTPKEGQAEEKTIVSDELKEAFKQIAKELIADLLTETAKGETGKDKEEVKKGEALPSKTPLDEEGEDDEDEIKDFFD